MRHHFTFIRVSIHAPARGATGPASRFSRHQTCFNPRPCERGDAMMERIRGKDSGFNPRPCERGDKRSDGVVCFRRWFQSTPLREGRRNCYTLCPKNSPVSIHAPARGATGATPLVAGTDYVSIHAPARGATRVIDVDDIANRFNPRPCERGDSKEGFISRTIKVSIHAPARGATLLHRAESKGVMFQSTPLREGRPGVGASASTPGPCFNPRPCERGDAAPPLYCGSAHRVSIHAPARGATKAEEERRKRIAVSIHAPARGATGANAGGGVGVPSFNPRPCERGDQCGSAPTHPPMRFQSTPLREGRRSRQGADRLPVVFQSTPLREGRQRMAQVPPCVRDIMPYLRIGWFHRDQAWKIDLWKG